MLTRLELKLHPDYAEFSVAGTRGNNTGFNLRYELLPNAFDYLTFRPKDMFIAFPVITVAALILFELAIHPRDDASSLIGFMVLYGAVLCAIGYGLRRMLKKDYTVLATPAGKLLIAKDAKHDEIVHELQSRRTAALKKAATVDRRAPPWTEVKKLKWLKDEGIISEDDYAAHRRLILSSVDTGTENTLGRTALH